MIPFTSCGGFLSGIRLFDQCRQRSNHDARGIVATDGNRELIWYSKEATKVLRNISCSSVPLDAIICQFAVAAGAESLHNSAIAILLNCDLLQLHLVNGEIFDIHLPFPMIKICSSSAGLILQRKHSPLVIQRNRSGTSTNTNARSCPVGTDVNGDGNFDLRLWLDESNEESDLPFETSTDFQSPCEERVLNPHISVADSLRRCIDSAVDTAPSPSFFSLAHPTAPIRPVNFIIDGRHSASNGSHMAGHVSGLQVPDGMLMTNSYDVSDGIEMSCDSLPYFANDVGAKSLGRSNGKRFSHAGDSNAKFSSSSEHTLLAAEGDLLCTLQRGTSKIVLWRVGHVACSPQQEGHIHPCAVDHSRDRNSISQATSVTIANSSVLEERQLAQREVASSPSSFLSISAVNNSRHSQGSAHSRPDSMNSNTLSMNVSHSTGVSLAGGMITSALMPFESLSGPSMSLERELRVAKRGGGFSHSTVAGAAKSSYASSTAARYGGAHGSSPAALFTFSPSPISSDLPAPTRQSRRLADQRRAASLLDMPAAAKGSGLARSPHSPSPSSPAAFSQPSGFSSVERERESASMNAAKSHRNTPEGHIGSSSFFFNDSTDGDIDVCRDGDGDGNREEPSVILAGDACMTALTTLDLRTLSSAWDREITCAETQADSDSDPGCKADLEEQLVVTFSGGEDCLGGLQIHFLLSSGGTHACFEVSSSPASLGAEVDAVRVSLRPIPDSRPRHIALSPGQTDSAPVACIRSIAHMQIPLIGGTRTRTGAGTGMGTGTGDSTQKDVGLSRYRGSPGLLPITLLMHGEGAKNARSDGMQHIEDSRSEAIPEVTVLIGGYSIGGTRPFVWTDDLEGFDLSPACPVSAIGDLSLHSLGIGGSSMLCVKSNPLSGAEESFLLSGPVGLFRGPASGINGTVAQAILNTFKTHRIVTDGPVEPKAEIQVEVEGSREDGAEAGCSFIVAETIALMLLIQSEMGPKCVLQVLLCCAFGMPFAEILPFGAQQHSRPSSEMLARTSCFHSSCSQAVQAGSRRSVTEGGVCATVRAVLFDVFHSVLQDLLLRGEVEDAQSVLLLSRALRRLVLAISRSPVAAFHHSSASFLSHPAVAAAEMKQSIRESAALYSEYYLHVAAASDTGAAKQGLVPGFSCTWGDLEEHVVPFTCSPTVPCALDWVIDCIKSTASAHSRDLPSFFTSDSLAGSPSADCDRPDVSHDVYPAIAFNRRLFAYLSVSSVTDGAARERAPPPGCSKWLYAVANAFVKTSKGDLSSLAFIPPPLRAVIELALHQCKEAPFFPLNEKDPAGSAPQAWPSSVLTVIGRNDLCAHLENPRTGSIGAVTTEKSKEIGGSYKRDESVSLDGLSEIEEEACRLRFADDDRVHEVCRLLRSSAGVYLRLEKAPEVSDLDHRHKLQMRLLILCRRSLACPVGRGALTLGSLTPLMAEALPCPPLSLSGRIPPNNTPLLLHTVTAPQDLSLWPEFHNGVAAGLRVSSPEELDPGTKTLGSASASAGNRFAGPSTVTRNWIVYNRTATADDNSFHAGVLLALGLQGHLRVLSVTDICDYLTQGNQPTTIALLVGLPASRLGTADPLLSKTLCLHVPSLLPPQHWDIEILPQVQTAALVGLGLLYCNSGHRLMTEFLSAELGRRHTADRDRGDCREAVSFAAAWALGVVLLGKGKAKGKTVAFSLDKSAVGGLGGLADLCIEDRLYQHLEGGKRPPDSNLFPYAGVPQGDGHTAGGRSSRVMEGDQLNTGVTGPGAAVALGLIYIRSGNQEICRRLSLPQTAFALESIRPDLLLYRAVARCLVLWDAVEPTAAWIDSQTPDAVTRSLFPIKGLAENKLPSRRETRGKVELDPRSALSVYLNVVTGHCWGIGLVFAGTANETARDTLLEKIKMLQGFRENKLPFPLPFAPNSKSLRPLVEGCIGSVALALACVMAGTGDLSCLRSLRLLRWKVDDVTYGTHLSLAMAIGILFLSGGSASLRRDPMSCACLLLATAPRFPIRTVDNQYHLQALRHLYVLAVETRALQIIDADLGSAVSVEIEVELVSGEKLLKRAPCLLPELITVRSVRLPSTSSSLYYPASMVITPLDSGSEQSISRIPHPLYVKRRPLLALSSRTLPSIRTQDQSPTSGPPLQSLLGGLKSHISGGRQGGARGLGPEMGGIGEAGRIECQLSLDYLLLAAVEPLGGGPGRDKVVTSAGVSHASTAVTEMEATDRYLKAPASATMSDIALALTTAGSMTEGIFLQAMVESVVTE